MDDIDRLVSDAKRLIGYASRTGALAGSDLIDAVAAVEQRRAAQADPTAEEVKALTIRLNAAVKSIYPITLIDLGSPWRPFGETKGWNPGRLFFAVLAAFIIATSGYYTWLYIQASDVLAGLTAIQEKNAVDKAERLYRSYLKNPKVIGVDHADSEDLHFEPYLRSYEELYTINDEMVTYMPLAQGLQIRAARIPVISDVAALFHGLGSKKSDLALDAQTEQADYEKSHPNNKYPKLDAAAPTTAATGPPAARPVAAPAPALTSGEPPTDAADSLRLNHLSRTKFLQDEGMPVLAIETATEGVSAQISIPVLISVCRSIIELYGVLILPALYGMIGTIVFELRRILNPLTPSASLERVIVRTALGGLAGISITFVFRPLHSASNEVTPSGIAIFGVAFILGFSIDVFFTMLDRMVGMVSQSLSGAGRTSG